jgi:hypothetical protein
MHVLLDRPVEMEERLDRVTKHSEDFSRENKSLAVKVGVTGDAMALERLHDNRAAAKLAILAIHFIDDKQWPLPSAKWLGVVVLAVLLTANPVREPSAAFYFFKSYCIPRGRLPGMIPRARLSRDVRAKRTISMAQCESVLYTGGIPVRGDPGRMQQ